MSDFDLFDPGSWFDDSGVLMTRAPSAPTRVENAPLESSVRALVMGLMLGGALVAADFTSAHSTDPIVVSQVTMQDPGGGELPDGYWPSVMDALKTAPVVAEDPEPEDAADPIL